MGEFKMNCPVCGSHINDGDVFCGTCGSKINAPAEEPEIYSSGDDIYSQGGSSDSYDETVRGFDGGFGGDYNDTVQGYDDNGYGGGYDGGYGDYNQYDNMPPADIGGMDSYGAGNKKASEKNKVKLVGIICTVIVIICAIATALVVASSRGGDKKGENKSDYSHTEEEAEKYTEDGSKAYLNLAFLKGTRCRVKNNLDGAGALAIRKSPSRNAANLVSADNGGGAGAGDYVTVKEDYVGTDDGEYVKVSFLAGGEEYVGWALAVCLEETSSDAGMAYREFSAEDKFKVVSEIKNYGGLALRKKPFKSSAELVTVPCDACGEIVLEYNPNDDGYIMACFEKGGNYYTGWLLVEYILEISDSKYRELCNTVIYNGTRCQVSSYVDGKNGLAIRKEPSPYSKYVKCNKPDETTSENRKAATAGLNNYVDVVETYVAGSNGNYIKIKYLNEGLTYTGWVLAEYLDVVSSNAGYIYSNVRKASSFVVSLPYSSPLNRGNKL